MPERRPPEICEPPFERWPKLLAEQGNRAEREGSHLKDELVCLAMEYCGAICRLARARGLSFDNLAEYESLLAACQCTRRQAVIVLGHQPVIYHPGLLYKNERASELASICTALAVNVIVDTDSGPGGRLIYPDCSDAGGPRLAQANLAAGPELYLGQSIKPGAELEVEQRRVLARICPRFLGEAEEALSMYQRLTGAPVAEANSLIRLRYERARRYLEVPLSLLSRAPKSQTFFAGLLADFERLRERYNGCLDEFRAAHGIENPANPFPNLHTSEKLCEVPFWCIDAKRLDRQPVEVSRNGSQVALFSDGRRVGSVERQELAIEPDFFLAPRGALITLFVRTQFADLFIHGIGGAKYEPLVDLLAKKLLGKDLSPFVSASASRYLLNSELCAYEEQQRWRKEFRNVISHTSRYLNQGLFAENVEAELAVLAGERENLLVALHSAGHDKAERSGILHRLNRINREIRSIVNETDLYTKARLHEPPRDIKEALYCREYPLFLFPGGGLLRPERRGSELADWLMG